MARPRRPLGAGWVPGPGVGPRSLRPRLGKGGHAPPTHRGGVGAAGLRLDRREACEVQRDRPVQGRRRGGSGRGTDVARGGIAARGAASGRPGARIGDGIRRLLSIPRRPGGWDPRRRDRGHPARRLAQGPRCHRGGRCGGHRDGAHRPAPLQALITMSRRFGEEGRELSYGTYLKVPELLALRQRLSKEHDELLFIVAHQAYELWFKVILFELEAVRDFIDADDVFTARHLLHRVCVIEKLLVEQIEVLETMSPQDFLAFRSKLAPASGFQSVQFREIEFLSGLKEPKYVALLEATPEEMARLQRRLEEPSVDDSFRALVKRRGAPSILEVFRDRERHGDLFDLCEALLDHDETFAHWRARHVLMVERQIGSKTGTGGSSGARYLRGTLGKRFYPELWEVRSQL